MFSFPFDRPASLYLHSTSIIPCLGAGVDGYINMESRHSLPRLHFENLKFHLGGYGIQNQTRPWAEEQDAAFCRRVGCGVEGQHTRTGLSGTGSPASSHLHAQDLVMSSVLSNCDRSEEFMQMFQKSLEPGFWVASYFRTTFYRLLFWKKYFRLRIPGSAQQNWLLLTPTLHRLWM